MGVGKFYRKIKGDKTVVAICYDFDKTLSPDDMQAQGYIQSVGYDVKDFWRESNKLAEENNMAQKYPFFQELNSGLKELINMQKKKV